MQEIAAGHRLFDGHATLIYLVSSVCLARYTKALGHGLLRDARFDAGFSECLQRSLLSTLSMLIYLPLQCQTRFTKM